MKRFAMALLITIFVATAPGCWNRREMDTLAIVSAEINEEGNIGEQMSNMDLLNQKNILALERRAAAVIKNEIDAVLRKTQKEWGADIFGFGEAVHRKFPREWQAIKDRWRDEFPEVK